MFLCLLLGGSNCVGCYIGACWLVDWLVGVLLGVLVLLVFAVTFAFELLVYCLAVLMVFTLLLATWDCCFDV